MSHCAGGKRYGWFLANHASECPICGRVLNQETREHDGEGGHLIVKASTDRPGTFSFADLIPPELARQWRREMEEGQA